MGGGGGGGGGSPPAVSSSGLTSGPLAPLHLLVGVDALTAVQPTQRPRVVSPFPLLRRLDVGRGPWDGVQPRHGHVDGGRAVVQLRVQGAGGGGGASVVLHPLGRGVVVGAGRDVGQVALVDGVVRRRGGGCGIECTEVVGVRTVWDRVYRGCRG